MVKLHPLNCELPSTFHREHLVTEGSSRLLAIEKGFTEILNKIEAIGGVRATTELQCEVDHHLRSLTAYGRLKFPLVPYKRAKLVLQLLEMVYSVRTTGSTELVKKPLLLITKLLDKSVPSLRDHLVVDWRRLAEYFNEMAFRNENIWPNQSTMTMLDIPKCIEKAIRALRSYFHVGCVPEIIEYANIENISTSTHRIFRAQGFLSLFLPNNEIALLVVPSSVGRSRKMIFNGSVCVVNKVKHASECVYSAEDFKHNSKYWNDLITVWFSLWTRIDHCLQWDIKWFEIFSRCIKYVRDVNWNSHVLEYFSHILQSLKLPVSSGGSDSLRVVGNRAWSPSLQIFYPSELGTYFLFTSALTSSIINLLGPETPLIIPAFKRLFHTIETFFHPSNSSSCGNLLGQLLDGLCHYLCQRIGDEKASSITPSGRKPMKISDVEAVVNVILPLVKLGLYSKSQALVLSSQTSLSKLASICPSRLIYECGIFEMISHALDVGAIEQPHQAPSALGALAFLSPKLIWPCPLLAEHLPYLLQLSLRGIDPGDSRKTLATLNFYISLLYNVSIDSENDDSKNINDDDCRNHIFDAMYSQKQNVVGNCKTAFKEMLQSAKSATNALQEWSLVFIDKILFLFESRGPKQKGMSIKGATGHLAIRVSQLLFCAMAKNDFKFVLARLLKKCNNTSFLNAAVEVRGVIAAASLAFPKLTFSAFVPGALQKLHDTTLPKRMVEWQFHILCGAVRWSGPELVSDSKIVKSLFEAIDIGISHEDRKVVKHSCKLIRQVIRTLVEIYPVDFSRLVDSTHAKECDKTEIPTWANWGKSYKLENVNMKWHIPSTPEINIAVKLIEKYIIVPMSNLELAMSSVEASCMQNDTNTLNDKNIAKGTDKRRGGMSTAEWQGNLRQIWQAFRGSATVLHNSFGVYKGKTDASIYIPSLSGLRLKLSRFIDRLGKFCMQYLPSDTKVQKLIVKISLNLLLNYYGQSSKSKNISLRHVLGKIRKTSYDHPTICMEEREQELRGGRSLDGVVGSCFRGPRIILIQRVYCHYRLRLVDVFYQEAERIMGSKELQSPEYTPMEGEVEATSEAYECYNTLIDNLISLSSSEYSKIRKNAQLAVRRCLVGFPWIITEKVKPLIELLGDCDATYPQLRCALHILSGTTVLRRISQNIDLMDLFIRTLCFQSGRVVEKQDEERKKTVMDSMVKLWCLFINFWQRCWPKVDSIDDASGNTNTVIVSLLDTLLNTNVMNNASLHWRSQMMISNAIQIVGFSFLSVNDLPSGYWSHFLSCIESDVTPIRGQAISILAVSLPLLSVSSFFKLDSDIQAHFLSPSFIEALSGALTQDHRHAVRGADGQVKRSGRVKWSVGVGSMLQMADKTSRCSRSVYPLTRHWNSKSQFKQGHAIVVQSLFRVLGIRFVEEFLPVIEKLLSVDGDERRVSFCAASEIIFGLIRGATTIAAEKNYDNESVSLVDVVWEMLLPLLTKALITEKVDFIGCWLSGIRFVFSLRDFNGKKIRNKNTKFVDFLIREMNDSLQLSSLANSSLAGNTPAKWVLLVQPMLVELAANQPYLFSLLKQRLLPICTQHINHQYRISRRQIGQLLCLLISCEGTQMIPYSEANETLQIAFEAVQNKTMAVQEESLKIIFSKFTQFIHNEENEKTSLIDTQSKEANQYAAETALHFVGKCCSIGDCFNFGDVVDVLLPVLLNTQRHEDEKLREMAKSHFMMYAHSLRCVPSNPCQIKSVISIIETSAQSSEWHVRLAGLQFSRIFRAYHIFSLYGKSLIEVHPKANKELQQLSAKPDTTNDQMLLGIACAALRQKNGKVEVQEQACQSIVPFFICPALMSDSIVECKHIEDLLPKFMKNAQTRYNRKSKAKSGDCVEEDKLKMQQKREKALSKRLSGVLGLSAILLAHPYSLPSILPPICVEISRHVYDPSPIDGVARRTLANFKRTHQDRWLEWEEKFTREQWEAINDVLISPHYYA